MIAIVAASLALQVQPAVPPAATSTTEKPVCRKIMATGSMFAKRECYSRAEWLAIDAQNAVNAENARGRQKGGTPPGG